MVWRRGVSKSRVSVTWTSYSFAVVISVGLHLACVAALAISGHSSERRHQLGSAAAEVVPVDSSADPREPVAVAIEPFAAQRPSPPEAGPVHESDSPTLRPHEPTIAQPISKPSARSQGPAKRGGMAMPRAMTSAYRDQGASKAPSNGLDSPLRIEKQFEVPVASPSSSVGSETLRSAMKSAAAQASSSGSASYQVPMVRVDPSEQNLDRAWSRAFAWAFATDSSFFAEPPTGTARFVLELADNGAIQRLHWIAPSAPGRLEALIQRMVKLLSRNRFSPPSPEADHPRLRGFEMKVSATRVTPPLSGAAAAPSQAGDLWMLEAGEIPKPGRPSRPMVADMTGHQLNCVLRILDALPKLDE